MPPVRPAHLSRSAPAAAAVALLVAASAGSSGAQSSQPAPSAPTTSSTPMMVGGAKTARLNTEDAARTVALETPAAKVWDAVKLAYVDLKLPVSTVVDAERRIGFNGQRFRGKLAGERLGKLMECGQAQDGRDAADSYEVILDVETLAVPAGDGTTLLTAVAGTARPVFTSGDPVRCVSTGRLEERIAGAVRGRIAKP